MSVTVWILGDQLLKEHPALFYAEKARPRDQVVVMIIESQSQMQLMAYHAKKITFLISAMRHYAEGLRSAGYRVDYRKGVNTSQAILAHLKTSHPDNLITMEASSRRGREFQRNLSANFGVETVVLPNTQFLGGQYDPLPGVPVDQPVRQEQFYRKMRQHFNLLMDDQGQPQGGQWNFDQKNRQPLPKKLDIPEIIQFNHDAITQDVMDEVERNYSITSDTKNFKLAVTHEDAILAAEDFFNRRLPNFGTYEDGMRQDETVLFHSMLAVYLNVGLLEPLDLVRTAERAYHEGVTEINNVEGFIRQVIGWREYMYWQYQRLMPALAQGNYWEAERPLPAFFWNKGENQLNCLEKVIKRVLSWGYTHHIERLMVLSNYCLLTGINPHQVYEWFNCGFIDAYEWVMVPNVYGMGLFADGGKVATKPYIASANYINKMSDYCKDCSYDRKKRTGSEACPFNFLYWNFLLKHQEKLADNPRMARMLYNLKFLDQEERAAVQSQSADYINNLP